MFLELVDIRENRGEGMKLGLEVLEKSRMYFSTVYHARKQNPHLMISRFEGNPSWILSGPSITIEGDSTDGFVSQIPKIGSNPTSTFSRLPEEVPVPRDLAVANDGMACSPRNGVPSATEDVDAGGSGSLLLSVVSFPTRGNDVLLAAK